ncbi:MAG: serine/threonine-protein kinase [Candidatus Eremiobacteraeota bacterium]|nr:serine/threonine-protein kinase [Candidatus Eremiobacteraeota bacterium]
MRSRELKAGDVLAGRYRITGVIGHGAYGIVYRADDMEVPGAQWAIKEIWEGALSEEERSEARILYEKEIAILRKLNHTGVPKVVDTFSYDTCHYLIMEYVEGKTLETLMEEGMPPLPVVVGWALKVCDILEYLHSLSPDPLIFRDLKPSNIMVTSRGRVILIDFGIARFFRAGRNKDTHILGTPGFSPPEQYGRSQSDQRSDIYSLGATFHHLLCGQDLAQFKFHVPPLRIFNTQVPRELSMVLAKCLAEAPEKRYQSVRILGEALRKVHQGLRKAEKEGSAPSGSPLFSFQALRDFLRGLAPLPFLWAAFIAFIILYMMTGFLSHIAELVPMTFAGLTYLTSAVISVVSFIGLFTAFRLKRYNILAASLISLMAVGYFYSRYPLTPVHPRRNADPLKDCSSALKSIAPALELYSMDNGGFYPLSLTDLTPRYMKKLPACPAAKAMTYGYMSSSNPRCYTLWCEGAYHERETGAEDFPQYDAVTGLMENPAAIPAPHLAEQEPSPSVTVVGPLSAAMSSPRASPEESGGPDAGELPSAPYEPTELSTPRGGPINMPSAQHAGRRPDEELMAEKYRDKQYYSACQFNIKRIATALEMYSTDNAGLYPPSLNVLVPAYIHRMPGCPLEDLPYGYSSLHPSKSSPPSCRIWCAGAHHREVTGRDDLPCYTSDKGFIDSNE